MVADVQSDTSTVTTKFITAIFAKQRKRSNAEPYKYEQLRNEGASEGELLDQGRWIGSEPMISPNDSSGDGNNQQAQTHDASREIMQSLFKDLGKQAMALEAILRVVCGKVDRMESWMTTISFGMSELDLKLRNIAHNIDGTSAVDDDVVGKQPWAVPPPDDDIANARAPVLSKKVGPNKKQVRVTGMAAAIIDKLAAEPKSTADKSTKKKKMSSAPPPVETPKKSPKKKKFHDVGVSQHLTIKGDMNEVSGPGADTSDESASVCAGHALDMKDVNKGSTDSITKVKKEIDSHRSLNRANMKLTAAVMEQSPQQIPEQASQLKYDPVEDPRDRNLESTQLIEESDGDTVSESVKSSGQPTPRDEIPSLQGITDFNSQHQDILQTSNKAWRVDAAGLDYASDEASTEADIIPITASETPNPETRTNIIAKAVATIEAENTYSAPLLESIETVFVNQLAVEDTETDEKVLEEGKQVTPASAKTAIIIGDTVEKTKSRKPSRSSLITRVLAMQAEEQHNKTAKQHRRSSSSNPKNSKSGGIPTTKSDKTEVTLESNSEPNKISVAETLVSEDIKSFHLEHDNPALNIGPEDLDESKSGRAGPPEEEEEEEEDAFSVDSDSVADSNSEESASIISVSDGSDDVEEDSDHQQSDTSNSAKSGYQSGSKRTSIAAGSAITRTMTALKKLKKANMLTPEEEEEIKQRAHEKWFKLKGHIKEKQKKEVASILLKRKKNVFTVSSRIELLEEKSREIFASIKQIGNELKLKSDQSTHEALRRQVADMQRTLQVLDVRLGKMAAQLTPEKVIELGKQFDTLRASIVEELFELREYVRSNFSDFNTQAKNQGDHLQTIEGSIPRMLATQASEFEQKLLALPDFSSAIEGLRRALRRKADLKLLKEYVYTYSTAHLSN